MERRTDILKEVQEISSLVAGIGSVNPYQVPQGYFETFAEQLLLKLKAGNQDARKELETLSPLLSSISRQLPFDLPANYFNDLSEQALAGVKAIEFVNEELENLSPLMSSLKSKAVYEVPEGYFDTLAGNILSKVKRQRPAKVVSIGFGKKVMRYAAAAVIVGVMAIGGWLYFSQPKPVPVATAASEEEMMSFLENDVTPVAETALNSNAEMNESDMKVMLANVPDEELEQYAIDNTESNNTLSN